MDKLSMKALEFTAQMSGNTKTANQTADVSGDFRKLLEGKSEGSGGNQDNKEISKDTKPENVEASDDVKKDTASEEAGKTENTDRQIRPRETQGRQSRCLRHSFSRDSRMDSCRIPRKQAQKRLSTQKG